MPETPVPAQPSAITHREVLARLVPSEREDRVRAFAALLREIDRSGRKPGAR